MNKKFTMALALAVILAMLASVAALASSVDEAIVDATAPTGSVTLNPGQTAAITINLSVTGRQANPASFQVYRDWTLSGGVFTGTNPQTFNVAPRAATDPATVFTTSGSISIDTTQVATVLTLAVQPFNIQTTAPAALSPGQSSSYEVTVEIPTPTDQAPPDISCTPPTDSIWYGDNVSVPCTASDSESGLANSADASFSLITSVEGGAADNHASTDTRQVCDKANNCANAGPYYFMVDRQAPTATASTSPAANGNGWNNTDVTVTFSGDDGLGSGIAFCDPNVVLGEGANQSASGKCTDNVKHVSAPATVSGINIDETAPTLTGAATTQPNANGWYNDDVTIHWTCSDALSGINGGCPADSVITSEGDNLSASASVSDLAGNTTNATVNGIKIDRTSPTATATALPAANANGWNNTDVTVSFTGNDGLSGIDFCDAAVVLNTEGAGQSASGTCTDRAGNVSAAASASNINIDKTAPTVSLVGGPVDGSSYYFGFVPAAPTCSASDALSGLDGSCSVSGYSTALGSHTVTASAMDKAGNSASASASYTVLAWTLNGFYQPVDMNGVFNTVKNGSTVPFKFEIFAGDLELTDVADVMPLQAVHIPCDADAPRDAIEMTATGGTSLRYDTTAGQFIYNWKTPLKAGYCYEVTMTTLDGSFLQAFFKLK